jgi:thiamine kinase-like enzyme
MPIKVLRFRRNSNKVFSILNRYIIKIYLSPERIQHEIEAYQYWKKAHIKYVPKLYFRWKRLIIWKYVGVVVNKHQKRLITRIATMYKDLYNYYCIEYSSLYQDNFQQEWFKYLTLLSDRYLKIQGKLKKDLSRKNKRIIENILLSVIYTNWDSTVMLPLHRDICLDNILIDEISDHLNVIDFEHSCIGPLEYDFCNSIFWADNYSIDLMALKRKLDQFKINFDNKLYFKFVALYFIEQYYIAYSQSDKFKSSLIIDRLNQFMIRYKDDLKSFALQNKRVKSEILISQFTHRSIYPKDKSIKPLFI